VRPVFRSQLGLSTDASIPEMALSGIRASSAPSTPGTPPNAGSKDAASYWLRARSTGRLSARYRAANFPRKRADGALVPEFGGVLETDDGGVILFEWQGLAVRTDAGRRRLLGSLVHISDACATAG
jgi:hypothetical protein